MLSVAILVNNLHWDEWEISCIRRLLDTKQVEIRAVVLAGSDRASERGHSLDDSRLLPLLERWLLRKTAYRSKSSQALQELLPDVPIYFCLEHNANSFRREGWDVILQLSGDSRAAMRLRDVPRHGVWSFRYEGCGSLAALLLRNRLLREPTGAVELVRLGWRREQAATVLKRGVFAIGLRSFVKHYEEIRHASSYYPAYACAELAEGRVPRAEAAREPSPNAAERMALNARWPFLFAWNAFQDIVSRWFVRWFVTEHWNVGVANRPIEHLLSAGRLPAIDWLPKKRRFLADPFGIRHNGRLYVLAEECDHLTGSKGFITAIRYDMRHRGKRKVAFRLPVHMSYPYLLKHQGDIYCIPETYQAQEVALYKAVRFPDQWEKIKVLISDFAAVDATVLFHDGMWWMFCTDEALGPNSHLHIWYASELDGDWRPHPMNPVKMDVRSARSAGTPFFHNGHWYRPAQDCSRKYGGAVVLNRIETLTVDAFKEETVKRLVADPESPYPDGLHTLSSVGDRTLFDAKIESVDLKVFMRRVWAKLMPFESVSERRREA